MTMEGQGEAKSSPPPSPAAAWAVQVRHRGPIIVIPMLALFIIAALLYCHDADNLSGQWILDDKGTITMNPIVLGTVPNPYEQMWVKDFWGHDDLVDKDSHKSWRPLCTATYYWNGLWAGGVEEGVHSYYFHLVDRILHAVVSAMAYPVTLYTFFRYPTVTGQSVNGYPSFPPKAVVGFLVALLFAAHPIHVEAVANTTGRAEVLCALFYFCGFCCHAKVGAGVSLFGAQGGGGRRGNGSLNANENATFVKSIFGTILVLIFTVAAMLSKEHGITLPIMCVIWDAYIGTSTSLVELWPIFFATKTNHKDLCAQRRKQCQLFLLRSILLAMGCASICMWRLSKNGEFNPDFVCEQNPTACETNRLHRFIQFSYLWVFNFWLMLYPASLTPDWSGNAIPLMGEHWATDARFPTCFLLWYVLIIYLIEAIVCAIRLRDNALLTKTHPEEDDKDCHGEESHVSQYFHDLECRTIVTSFTWMLLPFLMSSNLLVCVGFVVAERTLYLPSFGFCILLVERLFYVIYGLSHVPSHSEAKALNNKSMKTRHFKTITVVAIILAAYVAKQQAQTKEWSQKVSIWGAAYRVNTRGCLVAKEYAMALVNDGRNLDAIKILAASQREELRSSWYTKRLGHWKTQPDEEELKILEIGRMESIIRSRFKYVTALGNAGECDKANPLIDEAFAWMKENQDDLLRLKVEIYGKTVTATAENGTTTTADKDVNMKSINAMIENNISNQAYFYVAKSRCASDVASMASLAYKAVETRPAMPYTQNHALSVNDMIQNISQQGLDPKRVKVFRKLVDENTQTAELSFAFSTE